MVGCFIFQTCQGLNSHYFHIIGDGHQPNSRAYVGVYTPIIRIPIKGGMTIPNIRSLDCGTNGTVDGSEIRHSIIYDGFLQIPGGFSPDF